MNETRIYGTPVSVDAENVKAFWEHRAEMYGEKGDGAVSCGEQFPDSVEKRNAFIRELLTAQIDITTSTRVLDIGCGVGRLAKMLLPRCGFYYGVDLSQNMVDAARQTCEQMKLDGYKADHKVEQLSFFDTLQKTPDYYGGAFDCIIVCGVCAYINDEILQQSFGKMPALLQSHSTVLFLEPVGQGERLTLNNFHSDALDALYSAIYRTEEEYLSLYRPLFQAGFSIAKKGRIPGFDEEYKDTFRWYAVLKR